MNREIYIAADLGNSQLRLMAAERTQENLLRIIAMEQVDTPEDSIQNGVIKKPSDIAQKIGEMAAMLQNRIENRIHEKYLIKKMYLGINGRSLRTIRGNVKRTFKESTEITSNELRSLKKEIYTQTVEGREVYDIFEEEYLIDGVLVRSADGILCKDIQANYMLAYGRNDIRDNKNKLLDRLVNIDVAGETLAPIAISDAVLTEEDRQLGCIEMNFGAATTTVAVYQDGYLRHAAVVPFGGKHISEDLKCLHVTARDGERIKIKHGTPQITKEISTCTLKMTTAPGAEPFELSMADVVEVINARLSEIIDFCMVEVRKSGFAEKIQKGIVVTGGGTRLGDFLSFVESAADMPVRMGSHTHLLTEDCRSEYSDTELSLLVGLLSSATENCVVERETQKPVENEPVKPRVKPKERFHKIVDSLFGGSEGTITEDLNKTI